MNIAVETHTPSQPVIVVGVLVALLAMSIYFIPADTHSAFWLMSLAYVVSALGSVVRTE
jgi:hypothetical protein